MKVRLFVNDKKISEDSLISLKMKFLESGFELVLENYDLAIAIGGDGAFLHMVKECNFDGKTPYVGINFGTLGFLQEVKMDEIDEFLRELKSGRYHLDEIGIQETVVHHKDGSSHICSLNEIVVRKSDLKVVHLDVKIDGDYLERFIGDGILIASSVGSTAYNLSFGGSIVYDTFSTLQITPIAPLNTRVYRTLFNPVIIPDKREITLNPLTPKQDLLITIDGENILYREVVEIKTKINTKKIKMLRLNHHNFPQKINEKLLTSSNS